MSRTRSGGINGRRLALSGSWSCWERRWDATRSFRANARNPWSPG